MKVNDTVVFRRELQRVTVGEIPKVVFRLAFIVTSTGEVERIVPSL